MSALETVNRTHLKDSLEIVIVETAIKRQAVEDWRDLLVQVRKKEISPDRFVQVWKIKRGCYDCCSRALREGRLL